jgi:hypothetical protein
MFQGSEQDEAKSNTYVAENAPAIEVVTIDTAQRLL